MVGGSRVRVGAEALRSRSGRARAVCEAAADWWWGIYSHWGVDSATSGSSRPLSVGPAGGGAPNVAAACGCAPGWTASTAWGGASSSAATVSPPVVGPHARVGLAGGGAGRGAGVTAQWLPKRRSREQVFFSEKRRERRCSAVASVAEPALRSLRCELSDRSIRRREKKADPTADPTALLIVTPPEEARRKPDPDPADPAPEEDARRIDRSGDRSALAGEVGKPRGRSGAEPCSCLIRGGSEREPRASAPCAVGAEGGAEGSDLARELRAEWGNLRCDALAEREELLREEPRFSDDGCGCRCGCGRPVAWSTSAARRERVRRASLVKQRAKTSRNM